MGVLDVSIGPMLIGTLLNVFLLGVMWCQCAVYFLNQKGDYRWLRMLVAFLLLADTFNSIMNMVCVYHYTITMFGDFEAIQVSYWVFNSDPVTTVIISSVVQTFFAWRIRRLAGQTWISVLIVISAFVQLLCGTGTTIGCSIVRIFVEFQKFESVVIVWLVLSAVTDIVITASMVWYLRQHRTSHEGTNDMLTKLMKMVIQTGMITAVWATVDLCMYLSFTNSVHLIFNLPLSKLYTNSLLSSLIARQSTWLSPTSYSQSGVSSFQPPKSENLVGAKRPKVDGIRITTTVQRHGGEYGLDKATQGLMAPSPVSPRFTASANSESADLDIEAVVVAKRTSTV